MIPRIPKCSSFKGDYPAYWFLQSENFWTPVSFYFFHKEKTVAFRNLCNAARCAWLDEAEEVLHRQPRPVIAMYRYWDGLTYWESGIYDPVRLQPLDWPAWEIDYAHCLAWAEAWAREGRE